ncbi:MAG: glutamine synthetase [Gaiellales bacterium]|jgi:glutamine synthetase|nr:glutamine synthetase [Gaiellales bacterium]
MSDEEWAARGIELIAIAFVDNAGLTRAKSIPVARAAVAGQRGVGSPFAFAIFQGNDGMATATGFEATGDTRVVPDLDRLTGGLDGWGWAPGDIYDPSGERWPFCTRGFLQRMVERAAEAGFEVRMAFEHEWYAEHDHGAPAHHAPAYSLPATAEAGAYMREVLHRLANHGVVVEQIHPEYSPGQMEVSVGVQDALTASDHCVVTRHAIRTAWPATGIRPSFSPLPKADGLGNGCHLHFSVWRDGENLFGADPEHPQGLTTVGQSFLAGVLDELPGLTALSCASPISYRRLGPNRWSGAYGCWGTENREAALRFIEGSWAARPGAANAELKVLDASGNPYLVAGAVIAAGLAGVGGKLELPEPVQIEPSRVAAERGLERLPETLSTAADALEGSSLLADALGSSLHEAIVAVRRGEDAAAAAMDDDQLFAYYRWRY